MQGDEEENVVRGDTGRKEKLILSTGCDTSLDLCDPFGLGAHRTVWFAPACACADC